MSWLEQVARLSPQAKLQAQAELPPAGTNMRSVFDALPVMQWIAPARVSVAGLTHAQVCRAFRKLHECGYLDTQEVSGRTWLIYRRRA